MLFWLADQTSVADLDKILLDPVLAGAQVGICVTDDKGTKLFEKNSDLRFVPASNQKVLSVLYAFETLGPGFKGTTKIWKQSKRIFIETTGDPTITLADLKRAKTTLKLNSGLPIFIRRPFVPGLGPGWEWDDLPWYYAAQTSPLAFDHASFEVWAQNSRLQPLPPELNVKIIRIPGGKSKVDFNVATNTLTVTGSLPKTKTSLGKFAQARPLNAVATALGGDLRSTDEPAPKTEPDLVLTGKPLSEAAKECLEKSDNVMAEQLMALAVKQPTDSGTPIYPDIPLRLRAGLSKATGVPTTDFRTVDGSGLSRHNQIAPSAMCQFLNFAQTRPYKEVWMEALAAPGEGTMAKRLKDSNFIGKTGTMDAVVCLCGYVKTKEGQTLTLSFMVNNNLAPASQVRAVQDRFVRALEQWRPSQ